MELDVDVQKLSVLRTAYHNDQYKLEDNVNVNLPHSIVKKNMIAALKEIRQRWTQITRRPRAILSVSN